jgi:hypothetical protein
MSNLRTSSSSYGQFWYGSSTNFPGFLYKKNIGVAGKKSTKMFPGGSSVCSCDGSPTYLYNKYTPGSQGIGASGGANRRAKNRLATVCLTQGQGQITKCFACYSTLGQYTINTNGYTDCLTPITVIPPQNTPIPQPRQRRPQQSLPSLPSDYFYITNTRTVYNLQQDLQSGSLVIISSSFPAQITYNGVQFINTSEIGGLLYTLNNVIIPPVNVPPYNLNFSKYTKLIATGSSNDTTILNFINPSNSYY